jgi:hypothetical protein
MTSLGDLLHQLQKTEAGRKAQEPPTHPPPVTVRTSEDVKRQRYERAVRYFIHQVTETICEHIIDRKEVVPDIEVPRGHDTPFYGEHLNGKTFASVMPDYRAITREFDDWMEENGLAYQFEARRHPNDDRFEGPEWFVMAVRPA